MSIRINGVVIDQHEAYWALAIVARNPESFGISRNELKVNEVPEVNGELLIGTPDVNFTSDQILRILNPDNPGAGTVNRQDMRSRANQCDNALQPRHFAALAQEFASRFPCDLISRRISIHSDIYAIRLPIRNAGHLSYVEHQGIEEAEEIPLGNPACP